MLIKSKLFISYKPFELFSIISMLSKHESHMNLTRRFFVLMSISKYKYFSGVVNSVAITLNKI